MKIENISSLDDVVVILGSSRSEESDDDVSLLSVSGNHARVPSVCFYLFVVHTLFVGRPHSRNASAPIAVGLRIDVLLV